MAALKNAHATSYVRSDEIDRRMRRGGGRRGGKGSGVRGGGRPDDNDGDDGETIPHDPFKDLRNQWPGAVELMENGTWLQKQVASDFVRTKENEASYYGSLAIRCVAAAADASLAPTPYRPLLDRYSSRTTPIGGRNRFSRF